MLSTGVAYLLWFPGFILICGLHRLYAGKTLSGLLWLFTFGLLGFGQLIDMFLIPSMIADANRRYGRYGNYNSNTNTIIVNVDRGGGRRRRYDDDYDDDDYDDRPRRRRR
jgi:TM2 domain-containing membrane protein YozV